MQQSRNLSGCQVFSEHESTRRLGVRTSGGQRIELAIRPWLSRRTIAKPRRASMCTVQMVASECHNVRSCNGRGILVGRKGTVGAVHYAPSRLADRHCLLCLPLAGDCLRFLYHLLDYLPLGSQRGDGVPGLSRRDAYALRGPFRRPTSKPPSPASSTPWTRR